MAAITEKGSWQNKKWHHCYQQEFSWSYGDSSLKEIQSQFVVSRTYGFCLARALSFWTPPSSEHPLSPQKVLSHFSELNVPEWEGRESREASEHNVWDWCTGSSLLVFTSWPSHSPAVGLGTDSLASGHIDVLSCRNEVVIVYISLDEH